jgi:hypothetical protein
MDRTLTVFKPSGHKLAELTFLYDEPRQCIVRLAEFNQLYDDNDPADEDKSVFELMAREQYVPFQQFDSLDQARAADRELVRRELGRDLSAPLDAYRFVYAPEPILQRYVAANHVGVIGMAHVRYSFIDNLKEVAFLSARSPKYDQELTATSLQTNLSLLTALADYEHDRPLISASDLTRLPLW